MSFIDRLNPVALKEFRRYFRSRGIRALVVIALLISLSLFYLEIKPDNFDGNFIDALKLFFAGGDGAVKIAKNILTTNFFLLGIISYLIIPYVTYSQFSKEWVGHNLDLQFTTLLSPNAFVRGELLSSFSIVVFFSLLFLPLVCIAASVGGISAEYVIVTYFKLLLHSVVAILFALCFAALRKTTFIKGIIILITLFILLCSDTVSTVYRSGSGEANVFKQIFSIILVSAPIALFAWGETLYRLLPQASDRGRVRNIYNLLILTIYAYYLTRWPFSNINIEFNITTLKLFLLLFSMYGFIVNASSRWEYSRRVLARVPSSACLRFLNWLVAGGAGSVVMYVLIFFAVATCFTVPLGFNEGIYSVSGYGSVSFFAYIGMYVLFSRAVWEFIAKKRFSVSFVPVFALGLIALSTLCAPIFMYSKLYNDEFIFGHIFSVEVSETHLYASLCPLFAMMLAFIPSFIRTGRMFRRQPPK